MRFNMNTHKPARKWIYRTSSTPSWRGAERRGHPNNGLLIAVLCLLPLCGFLTGCGRKLPPQPPEDAIITYPRPYPNPKLEEWAITECPPVLELCSPEELCEEYPPVTEVCSPEGVCEEWLFSNPGQPSLSSIDLEQLKAFLMTFEHSQGQTSLVFLKKNIVLYFSLEYKTKVKNNL